MLTYKNCVSCSYNGVTRIASTTENILLNILVFIAKDKGPFRGLSQSVQRLAIELLFHLASIDTKLLQVLVSCCQDDAGVNISVIEYIVQVLYYRCDMEKKKNDWLYFKDSCLLS